MSRRDFGSIRKLPSGRFQARYRLPSGRMIAAPNTFASKGDAGRYLASIETDLARGAFAEPSGSRLSLAEWAEEWIGGVSLFCAALAGDRYQ